jgi:hypothetical protein
MTTSRCRPFVVSSVLLLALAVGSEVAAQTVSQRGFVEGAGFGFAQEAPNDAKQLVGDVRVREELFVKPAPWIQFAAGLDLRANTHHQVDDHWRLDVSDRGTLRPLVSLRRLSTTLTRGPVTLDIGKQFIRWGKTDIVTPTDRFAPRDFLNVADTEFLAVTGVRGVWQQGSDTLEAVWVPRFTPSRVPLFDQRWTVTAASASSLGIIDAGARLPEGSSEGVHWNHAGAGLEYSASFFNGFNYLPNIDVHVPFVPGEIVLVRVYPAVRMYGADVAVPTRWFTAKGETAYFTSSSPTTDEYILYVVQLERQTGEWLLVGGYAGEHVTNARSTLTFAPDRGLSRAFIARASYTIDTNRSVAFEGTVRQDGAGFYVKAEYSQAQGQHWRATLTGVALGGDADDFLGQYRRNSHASVTLRYSF